MPAKSPGRIRRLGAGNAGTYSNSILDRATSRLPQPESVLADLCREVPRQFAADNFKPRTARKTREDSKQHPYSPQAYFREMLVSAPWPPDIKKERQQADALP